MKEYIKIIIYILIFALLIILCTKLYNNLSTNYEIAKISNEIKIEKNNTFENNEITKEKNKASDFFVKDENDEKVNLSDFLGKPVVVNFWATWCGPCKSELPSFEKLSKEYEGKVEFMMVNMTDDYSETVDAVKQFVQENNYTFPLFFDTEYSAFYTYEVYSIPKTIFVDRDGNLINSHIGAMSENTLRGYIEKLIK